MSKRLESSLLVALLVVFALLGTVYSVVVPPFEASDELWHYPMVRYIADNWELPIQDPENVGPWRQEGSQPPLYYALAAGATFWVDTSDMETVRHLNPHVDNGIATPDGNINLIVHNPAPEAFPWRGTVLAVHLIRLLSVGLGVWTVYLTYRLIGELLPDRPVLALGAAAVNAFTPMFVFIAGSVNNDNLAVPLCSLALLMMVRFVREEPEAGEHKLVWDVLLLGSIIGLATLTKQSGLALFPLAVLALMARFLLREQEGPLLRRMGLAMVHSLIVVAVAVAVCGWWYRRNLVLYGDYMGWNVFVEILGQRDIPADLVQLWRERYSFMAGYWGNFGGLNVPMPAWIYGLLNWGLVVAAAGLLVSFIRWLARVPKSFEAVVQRDVLAFALTLLWPAAVVVGWVRWATTTWSSQGRLVFYAIAVWSLLLVWGLISWLPRRWQRWAIASIALFMFALSAIAPFVWIAPAYALPEQLTQETAIPHNLNVEFGGALRLLGYDLEAASVEPGGAVGVTLFWEALAPTEQEHTVFVHLLGEGEILIAQRDTLPGMGLLSTTWIETGSRWRDRYVLQVPATAYTPDLAEIEVGVYQTDTGVRLVAGSVETGGDNVRFGSVELLPSPDPVVINFGGDIALLRYDIDRRIARPGEAITLTLHWEGLRRMDVNYSISTQLIDESQRKAAQLDGWPLDGAVPTAAWEPGSTLDEERVLEIYADAPPGVYDVRLAIYSVEDGQVVPLPVVSSVGEQLSDHVVLTRVRVTPTE